MIRKLATAAAAAALLLTGCSSSADSAPADAQLTATESAPAAEQRRLAQQAPDADPRDLFLMSARYTVPELQNVTDSTLVVAGHAACDALDAGVQLDDVLRLSLDAGVEPASAGAIVGAAIGAYCPQHSTLTNN